MVDILLDNNVSSSPPSDYRMGPVWVTNQIGYSFARDSGGEHAYYKTTDGGQTWSAATVVTTGSPVSTIDIWPDWDTPNDGGTKIHIVWGGSSFVRYRSLDTATDTLSGVVTVRSAASGSPGYVTITKAEGGNLYIADGASNSATLGAGFRRSVDGGSTWTARSAVGSQITTSASAAKLTPANTSDPNDVLLVHLRDDAFGAEDRLHACTYDNSADSWTSTQFQQRDSITQVQTTIRHSDKHTLVNSRQTNSQRNTIHDIEDEANITFKANAFFGVTDLAVGPTIIINQQTDKLWIFYTYGPDPRHVYYRESTDGGSTWSAEVQYSDSSGNYATPSTPISIGPLGGRVGATWVEATDDDLFYNFDNSIEIAGISIALTGTVTPSVTEEQIRTGGRTIILTVSSDTWVAAVGEDNAITQALIDGLDSNQAEGRGWDAVVKAGLTHQNVQRTSDTVVTITLPPFPTFDIFAANETITATVPASALTTSVSDVTASPTFDVTVVTPPPRRIMDADHMREYITLVTPDGTRYPMNTPHQFGRWVISDSGKGTPPIDYITQRGPFQHGATVRDVFLAPRVIQLLIRQEFCDRLDWWDGRGDLLDAIRPNRQTIATAAEPFQLEWCLPNGDRRQINCYITEGPRFEPRQLARWDEWAFQEVLRFIAYDPLFFDPTRVDNTFTITLDSDLIFPITFPIQFGSGIVSSSLTVIYTGTWETFPVIVITGQIDDPIITNTTTGERLEFTQPIPTGRVVTIDLSYGAKTVVDDLGNNLIGNLSADSDLATFHIAPAPEAPNGVNVLTLTGTNPTGATSVEVRYFTRFFGI